MADLHNKKFGFTLAELMIVISVLAVLLAFAAPLITKRRMATNRDRFAVWSWADNAAPMNAFYYTGNSDQNAAAFFGLEPAIGDVEGLYLPFSKVVIRSTNTIDTNKVQRQIQFRKGYDKTSDANFSGTWLMDGKNVLLGDKYEGITSTSNVDNNVVIGYNAFPTIGNTSSSNNVVLGSTAGIVSDVSESANLTANDSVVIGYRAGYKRSNINSAVFIGTHTGNINSTSSATGTIAIGYHSGYSDLYDSISIGAYAGYPDVYNNTDAKKGKNIAIGYMALQYLVDTDVPEGFKHTNNVAIGYNALGNLISGKDNTAIGYNACANLKTASYKTCIGANSGPKSDSTANKFFKEAFGEGATTDKVERTYIGSAPKNYGGDAVLEIHNVDTQNTLLQNDPAVTGNTTTIINGNLIVRGNTYLTAGSTLRLLSTANLGKDNFSYPNFSSDVNMYIGDTECANSQDDYFGISCDTLKNSLGITSDRKLKNIGTPFTSGIDKIKELAVFNYNFKSDKDKIPQVGVIAQSLQKIFPTAVSKDSNGYLKIRLDEIFYSIVNAIKELDNKIAMAIKQSVKLENKITKLESKNQQLKADVDLLEKRIEALKK